jgi:type II secretory pathway pseudopilin PulG
MRASTSRAGFTLLEAAVAMSIIAMVGIGALAAFGADLRAADRARQSLPAASLARERMAVLDLAEPQTLRMLPDSLTHGSFAAPYASYAWTASAKQVSGEPSLVELEVNVTWEEGRFTIAQRRFRPIAVAAADMP